MRTEDLQRVMEFIPGASVGGVKRWKEATIEAAPGGIDADGINSWRKLGFQRASLGVQSFVLGELRQTGRMHDAETVKQEVQRLREGAFEAINIDLIAGLPGQTVESWRQSLAHLRQLQPEHVSIYIFEIDEDSTLGNEVLLNGQRYGAPRLPNEALVADLYEMAVDWLAKEGWDRYEISNFARPGFQSLHNLKYWRREPYVGFGADAHGFDGSVRRQNVETPEQFIERSRAGQSVVLETTAATAQEERFFLGLRLTEGVLVSTQDRDVHALAISKHVAAGLLEWTGERLRLTNRGVLLSNEVFQDFLLEVAA
jgi:oxygen-independent coproporphyrinogen III oxidase